MNPRSRRFSWSLRIALVTALSGVSILTTLAVAASIHVLVSRFTLEELRTRLAHAVATAAASINTEDHQQLRQRADEDTDTYRRTKRQLQRIRDCAADVRYVYTMRQQADGSIVFVVDAEENATTVSHLGDVYDERTPQLLKALAAGPPDKGKARVFVDTSFSHDQWGTWWSAYAPIYTPDGRQDGIVGLDISAAIVAAHARAYQRLVVIVCLVVGLLMLPVGMVVSQWIRRPLALLAQEMGKVQNFELDSNVHVTSRIIEVDNMGAQFENMRNGLRSFRKYVPASLVRQLIELDMEASLGGKEEELTVFFSDITGFTAVSEKMPPAELVLLLGEYFEMTTAVLMSHRATVDKYIGDAVMAFWGAPVPVADHAYHACCATLEYRRRLIELNRKWSDSGRPVTIATRIGLNTGNVIVGNIGAPERLSYTIIGDAVNLANRLEGACKFYGVDILIASATRERIKDRLVTRWIDRVAVVGKTVPVDIYALVGEPATTPPALIELSRQVEAALPLYLARQFQVAADAFDKLLAAHPGDKALGLLRDRCRLYVQSPPPEDWAGAYVLGTK